jgi:hypothetical protein
MSTTLTNHSGTFNDTAFSQAVVSVLANTSDATGIAVNITSFNSAAARRLQSTIATTSDITVNYQIQHINGESTASDIQKQLQSLNGSTALANSYKTLSAIKTVSSAATTTTGIPEIETRNIPVPPKTPAATPITGIIAGVVVGVIAALLMITVWCKRDTLRAKYSNRQQHKNIKLPHSLPDHESGLLNSTNSFLNNNSSSSNNIGMSVFNSSGGNNSNSVESFNFPVKRKPSASAQVLEETQSPIQQQLISQHSTGMIADSALADIDDNTISTDDSIVGNALRGSSKQDKQATVDRSVSITTDSTATTVAGTNIAAASNSSTSTELVAVDCQSSNTQTPASRHVTTTTEAFAAANATTDTLTATAAATTASTAIVKKSKLTHRASKLAQGFTSSITSVVKKGVKDHGSKIEVAVEAFGAVAEHIPYVCHAWGLCNEVILLFSANAEISSNCAEVVSWAQQMQVKHATFTLHLLLYLYELCAIH